MERGNTKRVQYKVSCLLKSGGKSLQTPGPVSPLAKSRDLRSIPSSLQFPSALIFFHLNEQMISHRSDATEGPQ